MSCTSALLAHWTRVLLHYYAFLKCVTAPLTFGNAVLEFYFTTVLLSFGCCPEGVLCPSRL